MTIIEALRRRGSGRTAVAAAAITGFALGAGGFAAAQIDTSSSDADVTSSISVAARHGGDDGTIEAERAEVSDVDEDGTSTSLAGNDDDTTTSTSLPDNDDTTSTSVADDDDTTSTSVADNDDTTSTSVPDDDTTSTSVPDDDTTSTSVAERPAPSLPEPFTDTYSSAGGSVTVSWSGTAFTLLAVSPANGYRAEIEDQRWDRIRVDFDGDDDARIEVRLDDGRLRVRID